LKFLQVIIPIVSANLAAQPDLLPRVIVPRANIKQQFQMLRRTITGLCHKSIVYLPFSRNLHFDEAGAIHVQDLLEGAMKKGTIWLCEPEHALSSKLLGLDRALHKSAETHVGQKLIRGQIWLQDHVRDIIDECDEVIHTKQQVLYTIGHRQPLNAAPIRWDVAQKFLGLIAHYIQKWGLDHLLLQTAGPSNDGCFPHIRLRSEDGLNFLTQTFIASIQEGYWSIPPYLKPFAWRTATSHGFSERDKEIIQDCNDTTRPEWQTIQALMIIRGMINSNMLLRALTDKRWRVHYGLDLKRSWLAVPYRAKDLPSPRSEFGHPDVTIIFTCLSYYYGGLDDDMMQQTFRSLMMSDTPEQTYKEWILPCLGKIPTEWRTIRGINLQDNTLKERLFPSLRNSKPVIDSYLSWVVFPRCAKEYPMKLCSSGWDLAIKRHNITTGFSGTNDGRFLFPPSISQLSQPLQQHTNATVITHMLREENSTVISYGNFSSSTGLIEFIDGLPSRPTVILDVGAQILDKSNAEFSKAWLTHYDDEKGAKAVVFLDTSDNVRVMARDGSTQLLIDSPFAHHLDQCLIYLDEAHTRGTDLSLSNRQAAVILGPNLTKDKLVQGIYIEKHVLIVALMKSL
jgi:hypothetical protein